MIRRLRKWSEVPIIVLSALNQENEITQALDNGVDDYLTKPFSTVILLSRINALLRRVAKVPGGVQEFFQVGELTIELTRRRVFVGTQEVSLPPPSNSTCSVNWHATPDPWLPHRQLLDINPCVIVPSRCGFCRRRFGSCKCDQVTKFSPSYCGLSFHSRNHSVLCSRNVGRHHRTAFP